MSCRLTLLVRALTFRSVENIVSKRKLNTFVNDIKLMLPDSLSVVCFDDCLILSPLTDSLLRTVVFVEDRYRKKQYECLAVFLPLYYPLDAFILSFSKPVLRDEDRKERLSASYWTLDECEMVAKAITEQAIPFLNRATSAKEFATLIPKICTGRTYFVDELIALSYARAGHFVIASLQLKLLFLQYRLQRNRSGCQRLSLFLDALREGNSSNLFKEIVENSVVSIGFSDAPIRMA